LFFNFIVGEETSLLEHQDNFKIFKINILAM